VSAGMKTTVIQALEEFCHDDDYQGDRGHRSQGVEGPIWAVSWP
jgi:hypothetical protein